MLCTIQQPGLIPSREIVHASINTPVSKNHFERTADVLWDSRS